MLQIINAKAMKISCSPWKRFFVVIKKRMIAPMSAKVIPCFCAPGAARSATKIPRRMNRMPMVFMEKSGYEGFFGMVFFGE